MKMSIQEYVKIQKKFNKINTYRFWPNPNQIEIFEKNPEKWILFACYLYDCGEKPTTQAEHYSKKLLHEFIKENLIIYDDGTDIPEDDDEQTEEIL